MAVWASWVKSYLFCPRDSWLRKRGLGAPMTLDLIDWQLRHEAHKALKVRELQLLPAGEADATDIMRYASEALTKLTKSEKFSNDLRAAQENEGRTYPVQEKCIEIRASLEKRSGPAAKRVAARKARVFYKGRKTYMPVEDVRHLLEETTEYPRGLTGYVSREGKLTIGARPDIYVAYKLRGEQRYRCFPLDIKHEIYEGAMLQNRVGYEVMLRNLWWLKGKMKVDGAEIELEPAGWYAFYSYYRENDEDIVCRPTEDETRNLYRIVRNIGGWNDKFHPLREDYYDESRCPKCSYDKICEEEAKHSKSDRTCRTWR